MPGRGRKAFSVVALAALICAVALPILWSQYLAPKSKIPFEELRDKGFLDFSYTTEVGQISRLMTQRTGYINRYLVNMRPRRGYLNFLLIDTKIDSAVLSRDAADFVEAIRYQCAALPGEETIACDSRFLDSIDYPGLMMEGDTELQPSLTRSWIIGHEIGHIVLKHGSGAYGFSAAITGLKNVSAKQLAEAVPPSAEGCKTIEEEEGRIRTLFYLEYAADGFALERIRPNMSTALFDFHHSNWFLELAGAVVQTDPDPQTGQSREQPKSVQVELPLDLNKHPPMLWRLHTFLKRAERTYKDFAVPALGFVPDLEFCFNTAMKQDEQATADKATKPTYYQNGFYIDGPVDKPATRLLGRLIDDLTVVGAGQAKAAVAPSDVYRSVAKLAEGSDDLAVVAPDFCRTAAVTTEGQKIQPLLGDDTCFAVVLTNFVNKRSCPPESYLDQLYGENGLFNKVSGRPPEDTAALATLTSLLARPCLPSQGLERVFAATLNAYEVLAAIGANGVANLLFDDFVAFAADVDADDLPELDSAADAQAVLFNTRTNMLWEIRSFARREAWFPEFVAATDAMLSVANESPTAPPLLALSLEREKWLVQMENGLVAREDGIEGMKGLFSRIIAQVDAGTLQGDEATRQLAYETANHVLFFTSLGVSCESAPAWAKDTYEQLGARFDVGAFPPEKLISSWVAGANCAGSDLPTSTIEQARRLATARLEAAQAAGDVVATEDALRGFIALSVYHYVRGEMEQAQRDIRLVIAQSALHAGRTDAAKFLDICSPAVGRCVTLRDISDGIPFDPTRYRKMETAPDGFSWQVVEG